MYILDHLITCGSRSDRVEIYPIYDVHIGKFNCDEGALRKQIKEIRKRRQMRNRHIRVILGGDQIDGVKVGDIKRFSFEGLADWIVEGNALTVKEKLSDIVGQQLNRAVEIFEPIADIILGAIEGNHERALKTKENVNVHAAFCDRLGVANLTDEAIIRLFFNLKGTKHRQTVKIYARHGYGSSRTAGAEANKITRMVGEWEYADICLTGHTHFYFIVPPKPVLYLPASRSKQDRLLIRYRYGANPGCWLLSHKPGPTTYESAACYAAKPLMTLKIVIWPFWHTSQQGKEIEMPKIEVREYAIL